MKVVFGFLLTLLAFVLASCSNRQPAELYASNSSHTYVSLGIKEDSSCLRNPTTYYELYSPSYAKPTFLGMYPYGFVAHISATYYAGSSQWQNVEFSDSQYVVRTLRGKTEINFYTDSSDTSKVYGVVVEGME